MVKSSVILLGKVVQKIARMRGGGSALPGLIVEKLDPGFVGRTLSQLPKGVVVISGTNGKTTTTKIVVELLKSQGLKVFTNSTGSNFTRGIAAALLGEVDNKGGLDADIAVLELDEAHAVYFVQAIPPRYSLILNVMRDQLDRFGEIDTTAALLTKVIQATTDTIVLNREDPKVLELAKKATAQTIYFGLAPRLKRFFPNDSELRGHHAKIIHTTPEAAVILQDFKNQKATFMIGKHALEAKLKLSGIYNIYNAAAALALTYAITGDQLDYKRLSNCLSKVQPAFGRGEVFEVYGQPLEIVLVKNPSGFRLSLQSFEPKGSATMITINDDYADGRDMSWLWDVDFNSLQPGVAMLSGTRAYDMALRLQYDEVPFVSIELDLAKALRAFLAKNPQLPKRIYCTYTAMLALRRELSKITEVERIS